MLYHIFIWMYQRLLWLAALRNKKARAWVAGRRGLLARLEQDLGQNAYPLIWVHSASTGEFEQAKPVIEALRKQFPGHKVLASFFSPSGYEASANYTAIDYRYYLPADTAVNALKWVQTIQPALVIFSKYDFWHYYLKTISERGIPLLLISAVFRKEQAFFRWYGGFHKGMLHRFTHIFVQDKSSLGLLHSIGITSCSISGDTRFDRVQDIVLHADSRFDRIAVINRWIDGMPCVVAGSTWPGDEALLASVQPHFPGLCWVIVPHEINETHISEIMARFPRALRYTQIDDSFPESRDHRPSLQSNQAIADNGQIAANYHNSNVLIVDAMGLLATIYYLSTITYVGGGFTKDGIHNTLEAAAWGKPVIVGPNYKKYGEAKELIAAGGAFSIAHAAELKRRIDQLINNKAALAAASVAAKQYVHSNAGATEHIMRHIQEKRLLTN